MNILEFTRKDFTDEKLQDTIKKIESDLKQEYGDQMAREIISGILLDDNDSTTLLTAIRNSFIVRGLMIDPGWYDH